MLPLGARSSLSRHYSGGAPQPALVRTEAHVPSPAAQPETKRSQRIHDNPAIADLELHVADPAPPRTQNESPLVGRARSSSWLRAVRIRNFHQRLRKIRPLWHRTPAGTGTISEQQAQVRTDSQAGPPRGRFRSVAGHTNQSRCFASTCARSCVRKATWWNPGPRRACVARWDPPRTSVGRQHADREISR